MNAAPWLLAAIALTATPALAQTVDATASTTMTTEQRFGDLDRDDDEALTLDEYAAEARARFDAMDIDHNLSISAEEMESADAQAEGELSAAQKIAVMGGAGDGILSVDEHRAMVEQQFQAIDANDDDQLELAELKSGATVPVPQP